MDSRRLIIRAGLPVVAAILLAAPVYLHAASGFVSGTTVMRTEGRAEIVIALACNVEYLSHSPRDRGNRLRIQLEATTICSGVAPSIANSRELLRPQNADAVNLIELDYDGTSSSSQVLTLSFSEDVGFDIFQSGISNIIRIHLHLDEHAAIPQREATGDSSTRVHRDNKPAPVYAINLSSSQRPHASSEMPDSRQLPGLTVFESEVNLAGGTWYRLRVGYFASVLEAEQVLPRVQAKFPTAWIDKIDEQRQQDASPAPLIDNAAVATLPESTLATIGLDRVDALMADARRAMASQELSRAIQIYTKVLRVPNHDRHAEAQEYLALAREKNGQKAHAKAEYQRYLALYPDDDGAARVSQRLAALLAVDRQSAVAATGTNNATMRSRSARDSGDWRVQTFFSQYYRRDANQLNEEEEVVSQSALYSDINLDIRRRGERFDFSSRLSSGYRSDFLDEDVGSGNQLRLSYAYADLADSETGLRGRIGRQTRHSGGVLGRFDGLNVSLQATERIAFMAVAGLPVNSVADRIETNRNFYGVSAHYGPILENLELGVFYIQQDIEGISDREAVGGEFRYFGKNQSFWGLVDYDTSFKEISSVFLQGSWRFASRLTVHGSVDRRHTPYLSTSTAMIGQPVRTFAELLVLHTEADIRQFSLDRAPISTSYTAGISHSITPRLQINVDANQTSVEATPATGGVAATPRSTYRYFSTHLTASSLLMEGDVSMVGLRMSESGSTRVMSLTLDSRFPIGRAWRINPRLRVDRREIASDNSEEWLYTPGIRLQYRRSQRFRLELEAGRQFAQREMVAMDVDRKSYFVNAGYQLFF